MEELIVLKQLPIIEERLEELKKDVLIKSKQLKNLVVSDETRKEIKKVKAEFNNQFKDLDTERKVIKTQLDIPYLNFMSKFNEIKDIFKMTDEDLKTKISEIEDCIKEERTQELKDYFDELVTVNEINFISYELFDIKVGISGSLNKQKESISNIVEGITKDIETINKMKDNEILIEYKNSLNLADAINIVTERRNALKELENEVVKDNSMLEKVKDIIIEEAPVVEEELITMSFTVTATKSDLLELKNYIESRGLKYE